MKVDSIGGGSQNKMAVEALKTQQNQVQQNQQQTGKEAQKTVQFKTSQDKVTISPEAAKAASEAQKGGQ